MRCTLETLALQPSRTDSSGNSMPGVPIKLARADQLVPPCSHAERTPSPKRKDSRSHQLPYSQVPARTHHPSSRQWKPAEIDIPPRPSSELRYLSCQKIQRPGPKSSPRRPKPHASRGTFSIPIGLISVRRRTTGSSSGSSINTLLAKGVSRGLRKGEWSSAASL